VESAKDVHKLERVQPRAASFVMNDYSCTTSVTSLLSQLEWSSLSVHRRNSRLVASYKAVNNLSPVPVVQPRPCSHQTRSYDPLTFTPLTPRTNYYKYRYSLPRTIVDWNSHSHYEPSHQLNHYMQVSSTSLSRHNLTEQNHNTLAVMVHTHSG